MGWSLIKKNSPKDGFDSYKIAEILVDTEGDLLDIPVDKFSPGSIAYTADRSVSATLNTKGEWVKHVGSGSGGSELVEKVLYEATEYFRYYHDMGMVEGCVSTENIPTEITLVIGQKYTMDYDGTQVSGIAKEYHTPDNGVLMMHYIGNAALCNFPGAEDTGENFVVFVYEDGPRTLAIGINDPDRYKPNVLNELRVKISTMEEQSVGGSGGGVRIDARASDDWETVVANVTHGDLKRMIEAGEFPDGVYTETWIEPSGNEIIERVERIVLVYFSHNDDSIIVVAGVGNTVSFPVNGEPFIGSIS